MESSKPKEAVAQPVPAGQPEEEKKQSRKRYDHLRMIEKKMQEVQLSTNEAEAHAIEGHEKLDFEVKNSGKYMTTFPYPYMNGYLHLGKWYYYCSHKLRLSYLPIRASRILSGMMMYT
jgi:leucyl-tRNA synthetase